MRTIHKYQLAIDDSQDVPMPDGATILCVQTQGGAPHLWALVDSSKPLRPRKILTRGTGHDCYAVVTTSYVGTYQLHGGALVFHIFDGGWVTFATPDASDAQPA